MQPEKACSLQTRTRNGALQRDEQAVNAIMLHHLSSRERVDGHVVRAHALNKCWQIVGQLGRTPSHQYGQDDHHHSTHRDAARLSAEH
jgi:hypothetical protein